MYYCLLALSFAGAPLNLFVCVQDLGKPDSPAVFEAVLHWLDLSFDHGSIGATLSLHGFSGATLRVRGSNVATLSLHLFIGDTVSVHLFIGATLIRHH